MVVSPHACRTMQCVNAWLCGVHITGRQLTLCVYKKELWRPSTHAWFIRVEHPPYHKHQKSILHSCFILLIYCCLRICSNIKIPLTCTVGTFEAENFREFRGFVAIHKVFSTKFGMWCLQASQVNNLQKFSLQKTHIVKVLSAKIVSPPTHKSFLPQQFSTIQYLVSMATFCHLHLQELLADQDLLNGLFMSSKIWQEALRFTVAIVMAVENACKYDIVCQEHIGTGGLSKSV